MSEKGFLGFLRKTLCKKVFLVGYSSNLDSVIILYIAWFD